MTFLESFSAAALVAHLVGDYVIQSDKMANAKTSQSAWAAAHAVTYALPFLLITRSPLALAFIVGTHFVIDRWRLARYVCWLKNFFGSSWTLKQLRAFLPWLIHAGWARSVPIPDAVWSPYRSPPEPGDPPPDRRPWSECSATGYHRDRPAWLAVWLLILCDNTLHILCNAVAIWRWS